MSRSIWLALPAVLATTLIAQTKTQSAQTRAPAAPKKAPPAQAKTPANRQPAPAKQPSVVSQPSVKPPVSDTAASAHLDSALTPSGSKAVLRVSPEGRSAASVERGTLITPLARDHGWVRVRVEGWVRESDLVPAGDSIAGALTPADLRSDPEAYRGRTVRWSVQVLSLQTADPLRKELAPDEPYFLAWGPGAERALLYIAIPPSLVAEARTYQPLTAALVVARVRSGRSDPGGVPILDLKSIARK